MANLYVADAPAVALTAGTAKTVVVLAASSTDNFRIPQTTIGVDATATGLLKVEFLICTTIGGTAGTAPVIARANAEAYNLGPTTTTTGAYSAEPTWTKHASNGALTIKTLIFPLPCTPYDIEYPLGREFYCPPSNSFGIRLTSTTVSPNAYVAVAFEE